MPCYAMHWREDGPGRPYRGDVELGESSAQLVGRVGGGPRWVTRVLFEHISSVSLRGTTLRIERRAGPGIEIRSDVGPLALSNLAERLAAQVDPVVSHEAA